MCRVLLVTRRLEYCPRLFECLQGPAQITRNQRNFSFSDGTTRTGDRLFRAEGACRAPQKLPGATEVTELRHCDVAQRQRRRVITQCDALQGSQGVAGR